MTSGTPHSDKTAAAPPPLPGEAGAVQFNNAEDTFTDADTDMETNELHAPGKTCARCGAVIEDGQDVRRRLDGTFQHDFCL